MSSVFVFIIFVTPPASSVFVIIIARYAWPECGRPVILRPPASLPKLSLQSQTVSGPNTALPHLHVESAALDDAAVQAKAFERMVGPGLVECRTSTTMVRIDDTATSSVN